MVLEQGGGLRRQLDVRKKEAGGNTELLTTLQGLEKKVEAAVESESDAGFMVLGLPSSGKEIGPLPEVAPLLTVVLIIVESADGHTPADDGIASVRRRHAPPV